MLEKVRDFINTIPKQTQLQCSTTDQVQGLIVVCLGLGLINVAEDLERAFEGQFKWKSVYDVIDSTLLPEPFFDSDNAPVYNQYLMALAAANRFGLYDASDYLRRNVVDMHKRS